MNRSLATILFIAIASLSLHAQTTYTGYLRTAKSGQGNVIIYQSSEIEQLVNNTTPPKQSPTTTHKENSTKPSASAYSAPAEKSKESGAHHPDAHATTSKSHKSNPAGSSYTARSRHKTKGYRICIFTGGNTRADKQKAQQMGAKCQKRFPELAVYTNFHAPRWVTYVGDFRTRAEAQKYVSRIRNTHITYEVRIVSSEVNLPE